MPPSFYLTADQHRGSAALHFNQKLATETTGFADILASDQTKVLNSVFSTIQRDKQTTLSVEAGANRRLPLDWLMELSAQYGRQADHQRSLPLAPQVAVDTDYTNDIWGAELKLDGPLLSLPGGTLKAALGLGVPAGIHCYPRRVVSTPHRGMPEVPISKCRCRSSGRTTRSGRSDIWI